MPDEDMSVDPDLTADYKVTINTSSPELMTTTLSRALQDDLTHVASNVNDYLENLEPELVRVSQSARGHAAIAPAPVSQAQQTQLQNGAGRSILSPLGSLSTESTITIAASESAPKASSASLQAVKLKRLGRACDACSRRKVKCDHARPCKNCKDLNLECTFQRPAKRRGPVNRVAEEIRRRKQAPVLDEPVIEASFESPDADLADIPPYFVSAELIGSIDAIEQFSRIFFLYIYPLYPFPHELVFMSNLESRSDIQDSKFVALIASIVGITVASLPRLARKVCSEHDLDYNHVVEKCLRVATDLRGAQFLLHANFTILDAITSFFLGLIGSRTERWAQFRLFMGETAAILQMIGLHQCSKQSTHDKIELELARRLGSALFAEMQVVQTLDSTHEPFILEVAQPADNSMPIELDDACIHSDKLAPQPEDTIAVPTGPVTITKIYIAHHLSQTQSSHASLSTEHSAISECIASIKDIILAAPAGLTSPLTPAIPSDRAIPKPTSDSNPAPPQQARLDKQQARLDVQKTAVQLTALACRTHAARRLQTLRVEAAAAQARGELESIAMELALLLKRLELLHVAPQWPGFINKMRVMLVPMQDMQDVNEDAAFVVHRMADFEPSLANGTES